MLACSLVRRDRLVFDRCARAQEADDLGGDHVGQMVVAPGLGDGVVTRATHEQNLQRCAAGGRAAETIRGTRFGPLEWNLWQQELCISVCEQLIDRLDEATVGAPVGEQRVAVHRIRLGGDVGEDIGAAEGVDGLLRIADQEQRGLRAVVEAVKNPILHGIGVLKLVDQCGAELGADLLGQGRSAGPGQGLVQALQEIVEELYVRRLLAAAQLGASILHERTLKLQQPGRQLVAHLLFGFEQGFTSVEKRMPRRYAVLLRSLRQLRCSELGEVGEVCGEPGPFVRHHPVHLRHPPGGDARRLILHPIQRR
ncbi:MAG: hypothetical protein H6Q33_103 [Deltaproteobacteria bacterium]|nr:hypothetical protein [Deltaproteobacteria bacterium]